MRLILTRHGETIENREGIIQGHMHGRLSNDGILQAKKVALRLKYEDIDFIYSSDLKRAVDTANEIHKYHEDIPIIFTPELREANLGEFQGKKRSEVVNNKGQLPEPNLGESKKELVERAKNFLDKILKEHINDTVLFVGHNGINKAIIVSILGKTHEEFKDIQHQLNTSVNIFEIDEDKKHHIHAFNCVKHLEDAKLKLSE